MCSCKEINISYIWNCYLQRHCKQELPVVISLTPLKKLIAEKIQYHLQLIYQKSWGNSVKIFLKIYLFIICKYTAAVFRHTRRGHQIPLQMVVSHHVVAGIWTQDHRKISQCLNGWAISPALYLLSLQIQSSAVKNTGCFSQRILGCIVTSTW